MGHVACAAVLPLLHPLPKPLPSFVCFFHPECVRMSSARVFCTSQKGQLGHGDLLQRNTPTVVKGLEAKKVVGGEIIE